MGAFDWRLYAYCSPCSTSCALLCVESYCATVTLSSATEPSGQYAKYDGTSSQAICSVDANLATQNGDGWTTIIGKQKRNGSKSLDQEKESKRIHG